MAAARRQYVRDAGGVLRIVDGEFECVVDGRSQFLGADGVACRILAILVEVAVYVSLQSPGRSLFPCWRQIGRRPVPGAGAC